MPFNSIQYVVFYLLILGASWLLARKPTARIWLLLFASYYFYASNNHWLIVLILVSTQVDYIAGLRIADSDNDTVRRWFLLGSLVCNLGILGFFKYFNFFASSVVDTLAAVGYTASWVDLNITLPVGISFYTFQSMSYTIAVYRGDFEVERSWLRFSFFVAYFPQLVAGPIVRASDFIPQITKRPQLDIEKLEVGMMLIFRGMFKKIVLSDLLAFYADAVFDSPEITSSPMAWLGVHAFAFQIYFDFSGYSDVAIGCSKLMGFELPDNFARPYVAVSLRDFWRRWHISLSTWLRDFLYIPLGGGRMPTRAGVCRNVMITMLLGGLWHGAAWNFVIWGMLHGIYLVVERLTGFEFSAQCSSRLRKLIAIVLVYHLVLITWVFFRAPDINTAKLVFQSLFSFAGPLVHTNGVYLVIAIMVGGWLAQLIGEIRDWKTDWVRFPIWIKGSIYALVILLTTVFGSGAYRPFIYFQF